MTPLHMDRKECLEPATICGLLKEEIKNGCRPLGLEHAKEVGAAAAEGTDAVKVALQALSPANTALLCALMQLFEKIVMEPANKMQVPNLGAYIYTWNLPTYLPTPLRRNCFKLDVYFFIIYIYIYIYSEYIYILFFWGGGGGKQTMPGKAVRALPKRTLCAICTDVCKGCTPTLLC